MFKALTSLWHMKLHCSGNKDQDYSAFRVGIQSSGPGTARPVLITLPH